MFNKNTIYRCLAILPLIVGSLFIILSEPYITENLPYKEKLTPITNQTSEYLKTFAFKLGLDLSSGVRLIYTIDISKIPESEVPQALSILRDVIERRVNTYGVSEPLVQTEKSFSGENRLLVELPGITNIEEAIKLIGETPTLEFKLQRATGTQRDAIIKARNDYFSAIASGTTPVLSSLVLEDPDFVASGLDGRFLKKSSIVFDPQTNVPQIAIEWNEEGAKIFATLTKENIGKAIGIFLDGQLISAPVVNTEIKDGKAVITGNYGTSEGRKEAKLLSQRLNTGALPVGISITGSEVVEATLGAKALQAGFTASLYGFLIIALFMIFWYRIPGIVGVISLLSYIVIVLSIFKLIPVVLSGAAIAGFLISIGLAVDGNILTFERLKEELKQGKKIETAIKESFSRSWTSIRDSNIASLIVAVILLLIGTSVIKGFALTLLIGVLVSMFTNILITRSLIKLIIPKKESKLTKILFTSPF